ncbi:MAG: flagellin, partial [Alphaproteobacteria bacterium]|nr:flagellin [Alphaproteobacteria bacterium]
MTLNIISNFAANTALRNLTFNGDLATRSVAKLSSGSRVVTAADDAASLA